MRWILDLLVAIVAARMGGDESPGIEDAHGVGSGSNYRPSFRMTAARHSR
jgi:hypothetical protein